MKKSFAILFTLAFHIFVNGQNQVTETTSAIQLIETIINRTAAEKIENTVDTIKEGNPKTEIKGNNHFVEYRSSYWSYSKKET